MLHRDDPALTIEPSDCKMLMPLTLPTTSIVSPALLKPDINPRSARAAFDAFPASATEVDLLTATRSSSCRSSPKRLETNASRLPINQGLKLISDGCRSAGSPSSCFDTRNRRLDFPEPHAPSNPTTSPASEAGSTSESANCWATWRKLSLSSSTAFSARSPRIA
ncbi:hypothetical protein D9M72_444090 [compost metagenome]